MAGVESGTLATGIGDVIGNKGATAVSFCLGTTSFVFINAHFHGEQPASQACRQARRQARIQARRLSDRHALLLRLPLLLWLSAVAAVAAVERRMYRWNEKELADTVADDT